MDDKERERFINHLNRSTDIVRSWPKWKRNLMGMSTPEDLKEWEDGISNIKTYDEFLEFKRYMMGYSLDEVIK